MDREAEQAKAEAERLRREAEATLGTARRAATRLRGQEVEVPVGALHQVARERLQRWLGWVASRDTQLSAEKDGEAPQVGPRVQERAVLGGTVVGALSLIPGMSPDDFWRTRMRIKRNEVAENAGQERKRRFALD